MEDTTMRILRSTRVRPAPRRPLAPRTIPQIEALESRVVPYNVSGNAWPNPPPVNHYSIAGDVNFNTNAAWHIGSAYDLLTVAAHEMGHALGLYHSTTSSAVMYGTYNMTKSNLTTDDINGIRNIYSSNSARS